jgi:hypothetical protein
VADDPSRQAEPPGDGWLPYFDPYPGAHFSASIQLLRGNVIEIWRAEWGNETSFMSAHDQCPEMNVTGLYWRLA